jgi:hypothetical protein
MPQLRNRREECGKVKWSEECWRLKVSLRKADASVLTFDVPMYDPILVEKRERYQDLPYYQGDVHLFQRLRAGLSFSKTRVSRRTSVRILPPSANSMIIHTLGPSVRLP